MMDHAIPTVWNNAAVSISPPRILLVGYYGFGNFGDDVLFKVAARLAHAAWPGCALSTRSAAPAPKYLEKMVPSTRVLTYSSPQQFDLIFHGGGGTFFDFSRGSWRDVIVNRLVLFAGGKPFLAAEAWARKVTKRPRDTAPARIGLGIGVGTFTQSSTTLRHKLPVLARFDGLMVRDSESLRNIQSLGIDIPARHGSDIAFLHEYWMEPVRRRARDAGRKPRVGVIPRDWPATSRSDVSRSILQMTRALGAEFEFTFFLFDREADAGSIALLGNQVPVSVWDPELKSMAEFTAELASVDVLLTARAHGAICGATLGVPSVLVDIEPKLRSVHEMLPNATRLLQTDAGELEFRRAFHEMLSISHEVLEKEVERNRSAAAEAARAVLHAIQEKLSVRTA